MNRGDIVLLSTADWDNPFWTNKQHVAVELARLGYRVLYIDSLGLRRPSASGRDLKRIARRLWKAARPPRKVRERLWVWSPIVLPWHGNAIVRWLNRGLLAGGLKLWGTWLRFSRPWLWTYSPVTTEYLDLTMFRCRVYHCVDEIKAQPGMPSAFLEKAEEKLAKQADVIFTTSLRLTESRRRWNPRTHYFPNVADFAHFNTALDAGTVVPEDLESIRPPRLGFVGAISGYKLDFELIRRLAEMRPDWSIVLIGEVGEGDPWTDSERLGGLPNLHLLGPRPYRLLPSYLKGVDVALLPNRVNEYTDAMFPMKFFEYLASGLPVVSTNLKALHDFAALVHVAPTPEAFVVAIERALEGHGASLEQRLDFARQHTYETRTRKMLDVIEGMCG